MFNFWSMPRQTADYLGDAWQRGILYADVMRQRGNQYRAHLQEVVPNVLSFPATLVMRGDSLPRPVNYALVRIQPDPAVPTDDRMRPFVVVDPRAGHGPGIGGFKADSEIGAALAAGVIERTVAAMATEAAQLQAWLGPCIGLASYEVGEEVRAAFVDGDPGAAECFVPTRPGHWRCGLAALARRRLAAMGVTRIGGGDFDTFTDPRFYSYRRDGARSGRFASVIWLGEAAAST